MGEAQNVFSLFDGKRFDLGLDKAGSSRSVPFSREGVSHIFCNIHPEMSAVVLALSTPLYAVADAKWFVCPSQFSIGRLQHASLDRRCASVASRGLEPSCTFSPPGCRSRHHDARRNRGPHKRVWTALRSEYVGLVSALMFPKLLELVTQMPQGK